MIRMNQENNETTIEKEEEYVPDEPVMITANIDDLPEDQRPVIPTTPAATPQEATDPESLDIAPDLGGLEKEEEKKTPSFQDFPEVPTEGHESVERISGPEITTEPPIASNLTELYQATSKEEEKVPAFQDLPEVPTENAKEEVEMETLDEEEDEEPKKRIKIIPIIMIIIVVLLVAGFIVIKSSGGFHKNKATINKRTIGNINIALIGDTNSKKELLFTKLTKEKNTNKCEEETAYETKFSTIKKEIESNKRKYNIVYPCGHEDTIKTLFLSDNIDKIDGAIIVIKASDGIKPQTIESSNALQNLGISKMIIYVIKSAKEEENKNIQKDIEDFLDSRKIDKIHTPVILGDTTNDDDIKKLLTEADSWYENTKIETDSYAVQKHKKVKLYTYVKTANEGGLASSIQDKEKFTFNIGKNVSGEVQLNEGIKEIPLGTNKDITIEFEEEVPISNGNKVAFYKDTKIVAIGVVNEIIQ